MLTSALLTTLGALSGFTAVALGAFGAHALKRRLTTERLATFEVGVRYQIYHALAIFAASWIASATGSSLAFVSGWLFLGGSVLFSGSLYGLAATGAKGLGAITPIGGVVLLMGWLCLAAASWIR